MKLKFSSTFSEIFVNTPAMSEVPWTLTNSYFTPFFFHNTAITSKLAADELAGRLMVAEIVFEYPAAKEVPGRSSPKL